MCLKAEPSLGSQSRSKTMLSMGGRLAHSAPVPGSDRAAVRVRSLCFTEGDLLLKDYHHIVYPDDKEFEVEAILDKRYNAKLKKTEYLVKFKARHLGLQPET